MYKPFEEFFKGLNEKSEYKMSDNYKKLSPKMKKAVDDVFSFMEKNPSDFFFIKNYGLIYSIQVNLNIYCIYVFYCCFFKTG